MQHLPGAALRLLLPVRGRPQNQGRGGAGIDGLVLGEEVFFYMLQLRGPGLVLIAALGEEEAARGLSRLLELIIGADIRLEELTVPSLRVHAQCHGHGLADLQQPPHEPEELAAGDVDAVHVQVRAGQEGAGEGLPRPVPEVALREIPVPQEVLAGPVEEGDVRHLPPQLAPLGQGRCHAPQVLGIRAALLAAGDDMVHPLDKAPALGHPGKEGQFIPVVQGGLPEDHPPPGPGDDGQVVPLLLEHPLAEPGEGQDLDPQQAAKPIAQRLLRLEGVLLRHDEGGPLAPLGVGNEPVVEAGRFAAP